MTRATTSFRPRKRRLLIADDQPLVHDGLRLMLADSVEFKIIGHAYDGEEAIKNALELRPDLVMLDLGLAKVSGLEVAKKLRHDLPELKIVILTVQHSPEQIHAAMKLGVNAFLTKDLPGDSLLSALKKVAQGKVLFSEGVAHVCAQDILRSVAGRAEPAAEDLSHREIEIITGITQGLSNKEIAAGLGLSVRTVITHRERLGRKLGLRGAAQFAQFALKHGVLGERDTR